MFAMQAVTASSISGALIFGMTLGLLSKLKAALGQNAPFENTMFRGGPAVLSVVVMPLVLLSGILLDTCGTRPTFVAGSVMLAVGFVCLSLRQTSPHALAALLLACLGAAALGTGSTALMPRAFFPGQEGAAGEVSAALNLGFVFVALGTLVIPGLTDVLIKKITLRRTLAVFALLALIPAFLAVLPGDERWRLAPHRGNPAVLIAEPTCWLAAALLFFYVPLETTIRQWTITLLSERGQDERAVPGLLAGFWGALVASRGLTALAQHMDFLRERWDRSLIVVAPLLAAVLLGNLAGAGQRGRPRFGLILLGFLLGPILPTLLGLVFRTTPDEKGTVFGLVFAAGSLGSLVLAPFVNLRLPIFLALLVTGVALVMGLMMP